MIETRKINWAEIELAYRAGILTLRQLAQEHSITHGAINKRAKRDGWTRDLATQIKNKADELVSSASVSKLVSKESPAELDTISAGAEAIARIKLTQRARITAQMDMLLRLQADFERMAGDDLGERVDIAKKMADILKVLTGLERQAYNLDAIDAQPNSAPALPDKPLSPNDVARRIAFVLAKGLKHSASTDGASTPTQSH
jgi:hypothetical protein